VAEEMSNEEDNEEDERDIRNRIIGFNNQFSEYADHEVNSNDVDNEGGSEFNNTNELNEFVKKEIERFDHADKTKSDSKK
jgi:hypothetical protein